MSRKREMPDGGAKNALSDLRFGRFVGRIRRSRHPAVLLLALVDRPDKAKPPSGVAVIGAVCCRLLADMG
ncbi:hypothetical protein [Salmonella enterica]|uniref:hypothetical protein n=1 Tax=Salmonella enterica TaxID=28901 RepID=UPI00039C44A4